MLNNSKIHICGVKFNNITLKEFEYFIINNDYSNELNLITPNVDFIVRASKDKYFKEIINNSDLSLCDSSIVFYSSIFLKNKKLKEKITGADVMSILLKYANDNRKKVFLLGSKNQTAKKAAHNIDKNYKNLEVVGYRDGFFDIEKESEHVINNINESNADILFIGMGSPRQEVWMYKHRKQLKAKITVCIGGLFEIFSNEKKRAPKILQLFALEWFWRFLNDPIRLWKRYFVDDLKYFHLLFNEIAYSRKHANKQIGEIKQVKQVEQVEDSAII
jgi:N-acetylglucosaminyldiphosphoundecaprenol N-acetyl-beta-D-mannosaminyltransferase